uniref:Rubredoxin n=1 Tax=Noccaea caerulescens TaxID=107243 RepID=A0A1J3CZX7_NOCCA
MASATFFFSLLSHSPSLKQTPFLRYGKRQQLQLHHTNYNSTPARYLAVSRDDTDTNTPIPQETETMELEDAIEKRRREEEKFAVLNTGIYECRSCGYKYDESTGDPSYPIPPGFQFDKLPEDWRCPTCGAAQSFFESKMVEIAGFAQNQQYGLGGNALTSGQKTALIFGSLFLFFMLFLSGYFIQ